jgi:citrate lyase beta subunit
MVKFRNMLLKSSVRGRILSLRIGGSDLLHQLKVRRSPHRSVYDTALGGAIAMLAGIFIPHGFNLSAPVFEGLAFPKVLAEEVERDLLHGLFGKTAVHPDQIAQIEKAFQVTAKDFEMASLMLEQAAPAVFRMHDTMCEAATHSHWAQSILDRARIYGIAGRPKPAAPVLPFPEVPQRAMTGVRPQTIRKRTGLKSRPSALVSA